MKRIYLDYNLFSYLMDGTKPELTKAIERIDKSKNIIVYSPAHIEEVAVSRMRNDRPQEEANQKLKFISELTSNMELLPFERHDVRVLEKRGVVLCDELPSACYERVIAHYSNNDYAEAVEKSVIEYAEHKNTFNNDPNIVNNISHQDVLKNYRELVCSRINNAMLKHYQELINFEDTLNKGFDIFLEDFKLVECSINMTMNILEEIRYRPETVQKSRSRLHDVTHTIYGAYCEEFITNDKKLFNKAKATYSFLGIPTNVISLSEFINPTSA